MIIILVKGSSFMIGNYTVLILPHKFSILLSYSDFLFQPFMSKVEFHDRVVFAVIFIFITSSHCCHCPHYYVWAFLFF